MKTIDRLSTEDIRHGIARCNARLSGIMNMGYMTKERCHKAIEDYKKELFKRGQKLIFE